MTEEPRKQIFKKFWKLNWNRKNENKLKKEFSYDYYLETSKIRVCKTIFYNTFSIPARTVGHWAVVKNSNTEAAPEMPDQKDAQLNLKISKKN